MGKDNNIPVLDSNNQFLSYTNPAKARILTRKGKAKVFCRDPYMLQLQGEVGENEMGNIKASSKSSKLILNFTRYFSEEKEVYVQNLTDTQISLSFKSPSGDDYHIIIPKTRKPYNLSLEIPFELIKMSPDFRKIVNRNPPGLRLMSEEEYVGYYERQAERNDTSFDHELGLATDLKNRLQNFQKNADSGVERTVNPGLPTTPDEIETPVEIMPLIVGLCARSDKEYGSGRVTAGEFLDELEMIEDKLTVDDWDFVQTKGVYKSVKNFAAKKVDALTDGGEEDDLE